MKRYEEYTTIDSRWANYIPASWTFSKIAEVFIERKETNDPIKTTDILSLTNTRGVIPYREKGNIGNKAKEDLTGYRLAYPEDIVFNSMNAVIGSVGLSKYFGAVSPVYYMLYLRDTAKNNIHFFDYVFQDRVFQSGLNGLGNGILEIRMRIPMSKLKYVGVPVPPRTEQDQIVRYLDWQVSTNNRLIAAKRKEIALLKGHRTAKINQAVTTGIHCDTQLAYTGYNWLPYAPANWKPVPAKALFRNITELRRLDDSMLAATQKYGLIEQTEYMRLEGRRIVLANDNLDKWLHTEPNDFIISLRSFQGGLEMCSKPGCVTWHYVVLRSQRNIYPDFYKWFFKSAAYIGALQKTSDFIRDGQDLRFSNFVKVGLFIIPMDEQREIAEYLNREIPKYDVAISNLEKQIDQITELRTRLISDVVTGQVDVRGIKVPDNEYINNEITEEEFEEESENNEEE